MAKGDGTAQPGTSLAQAGMPPNYMNNGGMVGGMYGGGGFGSPYGNGTMVGRKTGDIYRNMQNSGMIRGGMNGAGDTVRNRNVDMGFRPQSGFGSNFDQTMINGAMGAAQIGRGNSPGSIMPSPDELNRRGRYDDRGDWGGYPHRGDGGMHILPVRPELQQGYMPLFPGAGYGDMSGVDTTRQHYMNQGGGYGGGYQGGMNGGMLNGLGPSMGFNFNTGISGNQPFTPDPGINRAPPPQMGPPAQPRQNGPFNRSSGGIFR